MPSNRRFLLYFAWDKKKEADKPLEELDDRFPTLFELRRTAWPFLRNLSGGEQGITGFLDRVVLEDFQMFVNIVTAETGVQPTIISSRDSDGTAHSLKEVLMTHSVNTLIVVSLDHFNTQQTPTLEDLDEIREFIARPDSMLIICPHHCVGGEGEADNIDTGNAFNRRVQEHRHHADPLVPSTQRLGGYARKLLHLLGLPMENLYGLRPYTGRDNQPMPIKVDRDLDTEKFLGREGLNLVSTFNAHPHLPHLQPVGSAVAAYRVLARQQISPDADSHPFTAEGNTHFNALLWAPPSDGRSGHVLVCDATLWSSAFKGINSLTNLWRNLAARSVSGPM